MCLFLMYCFFINCIGHEKVSSEIVIGKKFTEWIGLTFFGLDGEQTPDYP